MNTLKKILSVAALALAVAFTLPASAQAPVVWSGGNLLTNTFTSAFLTTNALIDVTKPPNQFVNPYTARDNSWFEVPKNQGISVQVEYSGQSTNTPIIIEASLNPTSRTNWTNNRFLVINLPTVTGVIVTNVASSVFANVRGIRLANIPNTNGAGSIIVTNIIVGAWK